MCIRDSPYTELFYYPDPEDPWEYTWVDFTGKEIGRLLSRTGFSFSWPVAPVIGAEDILPLFDRLGRLDFLSRGKGEANGLLLAILGVYGDIFPAPQVPARKEDDRLSTCLLYTSDAADDLLFEDLGGPRTIKKKKN